MSPGAHGCRPARAPRMARASGRSCRTGRRCRRCCSRAHTSRRIRAAVPACNVGGMLRRPRRAISIASARRLLRPDERDVAAEAISKRVCRVEAHLGDRQIARVDKRRVEPIELGRNLGIRPPRLQRSPLGNHRRARGPEQQPTGDQQRDEADDPALRAAPHLGMSRHSDAAQQPK